VFGSSTRRSIIILLRLLVLVLLVMLVVVLGRGTHDYVVSACRRRLFRMNPRKTTIEI
jgi:hypothetical protein